MAYEELIQSMEADAGQRAREVRDQAQRGADETREAARAAGEVVRERLLAEARRRIEVERHQQLYRAREEAKAGLAGVREEYMRRALDLAGERLACLRGGEGYAGVLERLTREAIEALAEPGARVHVDPRDEATVRAFAEELPGQPVLIADLDAAGGIVVDSADGLVRVDNTFASRLARAAETYRRDLYDHLFEE